MASLKSILLAISCVCALQAQTGVAKNWNAQTAAAYLDARMSWWAAWPSAARDRGTFCVSCHTSLPYALARPALRGELHEQSPSPGERTFLDNITRRVSLWNEVQPFYSDAKNGPPKSAEARATEAVINALVLTRYGAPAAKDALRNMWSLQIETGEKAGSFAWLDFHNEPWEAGDSGFWGASLAALAAGAAPDSEFQSNVALLAGYLRREEQTQSTLNRAAALWASGKLPRLLTQAQRSAIVEAILAQQRDDGGWNEASLAMKDWKRRDGTAMDGESDGYATGLMVIALKESGMNVPAARIERGIAWLERNQDAAGAWVATSMNKKRDPASDAGRFMTDAATAYAVLALSAK